MLYSYQNLIAIAVGGMIGAVSRFVVSNVMQDLIGPGFAWGTLIANLTGAFLIGMSYHLAVDIHVSAPVKFMLVTGSIGAFTTFSTFSLEVVQFCRDGAWWTAGIYVLVSNVGSIGLAFAGFGIGHLTFAKA